MKQLYEEDFVNALFALYQKYWNDTVTYESDHDKYAYIPYDDLTELEDICTRIESLDS